MRVSQPLNMNDRLINEKGKEEHTLSLFLCFWEAA